VALSSNETIRLQRRSTESVLGLAFRVPRRKTFG
jgi:hypothetical protein